MMSLPNITSDVLKVIRNCSGMIFDMFIRPIICTFTTIKDSSTSALNIPEILAGPKIRVFCTVLRKIFQTAYH